MSAWSDYKVTGDKADLEIYRQECQADEDEYWQEIEAEEANREIAEFEEYQEIIHLKNWKDDVIKSLAEYDAETVEEVYRKGRADAIDEIFEKADEKMKEQIEYLEQSPRNGKMWARYMATYLGHIKVACEQLKEQANE